MDSIRREIGFHQEANNIGQIGRLCVVGVLIQLARGDVVAAEKIYKVSMLQYTLNPFSGRVSAPVTTNRTYTFLCGLQ